MAITYINSSYITNTGLYEFERTVPVPTNTQDGDIIFIIATAYNTISTPTGFTLLQNLSSAGLKNCSLFYKIASSEGSGYTITFGNSTSSLISAHTFRGGFDVTNPIDTFNTVNYNNSGGTSIIIPSLNVASPNSYVLLFNSCVNSDPVTSTPPTSPVTFTEVYDFGSGTPVQYSQEVSYGLISSSGNAGTITTTISNSSNYRVGFAVSLNPIIAGSSKFFQLF